MAVVNEGIERDRQLIQQGRQQGTAATIAVYSKLSGPGWLQGAITLGGGSLAGSLYLGVIGGYQMMWLQPLMMILGIIMLSAIGYVALSTGERPFHAINRHVNPVLGWGWAIATLMANLVWAMPQFSLGTAALQQNLLPGQLDGDIGKIAAVVFLFVISGSVIWFYDSGGWGLKLFEIILKIMVGVIVLSFFGVVITLAISKQGLPWGDIFAGFIPNFNLLFEPADRFQEFLSQTSAADYWRTQILNTQRDRMVTAAATAVGINMTFLLPYSFLKRGWDKDFRGLAMFDLSTGLFIPFVLATSCVVIASASQFHGTYDPGLLGDGPRTAATAKLESSYKKGLEARLKHELGATQFAALSDSEKANRMDSLPTADRQVAAMLVARDAFLLANSLEKLTGKVVAQYVFGIGVVGMAISTIIILMLINGFTICELLGLPSQGIVYRVGCALPGISGAMGFLFLWGEAEARFWLAVPTSVFGMVLLPIAYITFFLMMNNRNLLGEHLPRGGNRVCLNVLMLIALAAATVGASWSIWGRTQPIPGTDIMVRWVGIGVVVAFVALAIVVHFVRSPNQESPE